MNSQMTSLSFKQFNESLENSGILLETSALCHQTDVKLSHLVVPIVSLIMLSAVLLSNAVLGVCSVHVRSLLELSESNVIIETGFLSLHALLSCLCSC